MDVSKIYIDCFNDLSPNKKISVDSLLKKLEKMSQSGRSAEEALRAVFSSGQGDLMNYVCRNIRVSDKDDAGAVLDFVLDFNNKTFYNVYLSYDTEDGDKYDIDDPINREFEVTDENVESYMQNLAIQHKNNKLRYSYGIGRRDFLVIKAYPISGPLKNEEDAVLTLESYPLENSRAKESRTNKKKLNNTWENNNTLLRESVNYKIYEHDDIIDKFDLVIYNALKDAFYRVPNFDVTTEGSGSDKIYCATVPYIRKDEFKWFPKSHIRDELKKEFPDRKISITSYSHPMLTSGNYEVIITLKPRRN